MPDPELGNGWAAPARKRRKPRDYIFEGLCVACNKNPKALCKFDRDRLNAAGRQLKEKGVANDLDGKRMVVARGKRWAKVYHYKGPLVNPMQLVADWDGCGKIGAVRTFQPGHDPKVQAEWDDRTRRHQQAARIYWRSLAPSVRRIVRGCQFRNEQHEFETAMRAFDETDRPGFKEH